MGVREGVVAAAIVADRMRRAVKRNRPAKRCVKKKRAAIDGVEPRQARL
jgi:hypothetical protein